MSTETETGTPDEVAALALLNDAFTTINRLQTRDWSEGPEWIEAFLSAVNRRQMSKCQPVLILSLEYLGSAEAAHKAGALTEAQLERVQKFRKGFIKKVKDAAMAGRGFGR